MQKNIPENNNNNNNLINSFEENKKVINEESNDNNIKTNIFEIIKMPFKFKKLQSEIYQNDIK